MTALAISPRRPTVGRTADLNEFVWMGRCELNDGPVIQLYKHAGSRRNPSLDHAGFSYRYHARGDTRRLRTESPLAALHRVLGGLDYETARHNVPDWSTPTDTPASPSPGLSL